MLKIFKSRKTIILIILIVGIYLRFVTFNNINYGHNVKKRINHVYVNNVNKKSNIPIQPTNNNLSLVNKYFSLSLPTGFILQNNSGNSASLLFYGNYLDNNLNNTLILTIGLSELPSTGIDGDSSFELRKNNPTTYAIENISSNGGDDWLSYGKSSDGVVCFMVNNNYLATVSLKSGFDQSTQYVNSEISLMKSIINNWQWQ